MRRKRHPQDQTTRLPDSNDPAFRVTCNEIAEQLSRSWRFKLQVIGIVAGTLFVLAAAINGIVGWNILASLAKERQRFQEEAQHDIGAAKKAVEAEIAEQFKKENVQKTVELAAATEASSLLRKSVEPNIKVFQEKLELNTADVDARFEKFNQLVEKTEKTVTEDVAALRIELQKLQKRNEVTALADRAISEGDVEAYRRLEELIDTSHGDEQNAVTSELFRVFQAYSIFSGVSRTGSIELNVHAINPTKTKEEELEIEEILPLLKHDNALGRVKVAQLISKKAKRGSFKTAESIAEALKRETHLEAFKTLGQAFHAATGYQAEGKLDQRELLKWWEENKSRLRNEDTDASPAPALTPSPGTGKH